MKSLITYAIVMLITLPLQAQTKTISIEGKVTSASDGLPLPGVNVIVKGTNNGTQTNFDGDYKLEAKTGDILTFTYVGMKTKEVSIGSNSIINVILDDDLSILNEVVVVAHGTKREKRALGYSVNSVRSESLRRKRRSSVIQRLQGKTSGVNISNQSGRPGSSTHVVLRGYTAMSGTQRPLYIIDGVPVNEKSFKKLKAKKIKDVKVLKGLAAAQLYGTSGKNGVIVISTKKGDSRTNNNHINESYEEIIENSFEHATTSPLSTFSIDVDKASYSNIRRMINNGITDIPADAVKIEEMINYFDYTYEQPKDEHPFAISTEVCQTPWNQDTKIVRIGLQGKQYETEQLPASNLTFLIDVSGSMGSDNKLPLLKSAFKLLVNQLREKDRVAIVVYAGAAGVVLEPTSGKNKDKILAALDNLNSGGSTAGGEGIRLAYDLAQKNFVENGNNRVILATDGDFNVGPSSDRDMKKLIEQRRRSGVFLSVLGFGYGNYKDSKLEILADKGNGNHAYIDNMQEANKVFGKEFGGTLYTIAKDVKIQVEFNPSLVKAYRLIGYENRLLEDEDFVDDTKDAGELGSGHKVTALYEVIPVGVKSKYLNNVTDLKYTNTSVVENLNDELLTVKFRYKKPDGRKSIEMTHILKNEISEPSDNLKFASAVALFGMKLRSSKFFNNAKKEDVIRLAEAGRGEDKDGYRAEFIRLVKSY